MESFGKTDFLEKRSFLFWIKLGTMDGECSTII